MSRAKISDTKRQVVFARDRFTCVYCGEEAWSIGLEHREGRIYLLPKGVDGRCFEIDHVVPYSETRDNSLNNLCTACFSCNSKKSNRRLPKDFPRFKCDIGS